MGVNQPTGQQATTNAPPKSIVQPCPACGGMLVPLRHAWRCSRCYFSLCVGCEPETLPAGSADQACPAW
jgi:hypothetical protein